MKTNKVFLSLLLVTSLASITSCDDKGKTTSSSSSISSLTSTGTSSSSPLSSESTSSSSSTSSVGEETDKIELMMMGDLYINNMRSIYALVDESLKGQELVWTSSDTNVISLTGVDASLPEAYLSARNYGTATITCSLANDPSIYVTKVVEVKEGEVMPVDLYKKVTGSVKFTSNQEMLSFDANYNSSVEESYTVTTIFEENKPTPDRLTEIEISDAYELVAKNNKTQEEEVYRYVRSSNDKVATEIITKDNTIGYDVVLNEDDQVLSWDGSFYVNMFNYPYGVTNEDFISVDGGKTYHFIGGYLNASYICASLFLMDMAPDDMYFTISDDNMSFSIDIDPYNSEADAQVKYGQKIVSAISEVGTAKIQHLQVFEHEAYHDAIDEAITKMAGLKNYKVGYNVDFDGTDDDRYYEFIYTEDTIDQKIMTSDKKGVISHTGIHKAADDQYYEYIVNNDGTISIEEIHNSYWETDKIKRYPTFDFASEIFADKDSNNRYISRCSGSNYIRYMAYLPGTFDYVELEDNGYITLDDNGYIASAFANGTFYDEDVSISMEFSEFNLADLELDFSNAGQTIPTSWEEDNPSLFEELTNWTVGDIPLVEQLPYLYSSAGYDNYCGWLRGDDGMTPKCVYFSTGDFETADGEDDVEAINKFIADYKALLLENDFSLTDMIDPDNDDAAFYTNGTLNVSIAREMNWSGEIGLGSVKLNITACDGNEIVDNSEW